MKNRWIWGLALATALVLGACAPPNQGAGESADAAESSPPAATAEPMESESAEPMETEEAAASESAAPTPDDYEY